MKRYLRTHLPMALMYSLVVFVVNGGWNNWLDWIWLMPGAVLGVLLLFIDRVVYVYSYPGTQIAQQFDFYWKAKRYFDALNLLDLRRLEQERLAFRSALFMTVWVPLAFFALTSTTSLFGKGVVMGLMLHILTDAWRLQKTEPRRLHIRLFWMIKRVVTDEERLVFMYAMTAIFTVMSFWIA